MHHLKSLLQVKIVTTLFIEKYENICSDFTARIIPIIMFISYFTNISLISFLILELQ